MSTEFQHHPSPEDYCTHPDGCAMRPALFVAFDEHDGPVCGLHAKGGYFDRKKTTATSHLP